ncbi:hypothetical protein E2562_018049 [Oryza meyeriana var. granulata]|uniref:Uncharacterized protein n=1 Tax=Oryza meyeriana var. granulata TaxID=110450 RepID=A0A6G1CR21_9ORYZ|nr:hypothetical protein E2562_018049 [Oryza meyeriana var. granulata]
MAWCTATLTAAPPPSMNRVACTMSTGMVSSGNYRMGSSRKKVGMSCHLAPDNIRVSLCLRLQDCDNVADSGWRAVDDDIAGRG